MMARAAPVAHIQTAVAGHFCISRLDLLSERRGAHIARPRQIAYYLARELTRFSMSAIGQMFGGRDHSTIIHGIAAVERRMFEDARAAKTIGALRDQLEAEISPVDNRKMLAGDIGLVEA